MGSSPLDEAREKIKRVVGGLFLTAFLLGLTQQLIVPVVWAAGFVSALWLLRLAITRWWRR
ncbi:hypothetical protein EV186_104369 [Labedaea rhizosphaerae]|uniref:Uncharacterized protein n=1 Tax=Labedaea rhizosphaerae TaxID=598644 RepID=A0A4R6SA60_LABRH|nr:hypothetical protein EV186_104369 [Labedaea rhizosphaerae]